MIQAQIEELAKEIRQNPDRWLKACEDNPDLAKTQFYWLGLAMPIIANTMVTMANAEIFDNLQFSVDELLNTQAEKILEQAENDRMQAGIERREDYNEMVKREIFK